MTYQIKRVAELLGVPRNTLIAWERRYAIVDPVRTPAGYRLYSELDLARLRRVKELVDEGYKVGEACRIVLDESGRPAALPESAATAAESELSVLGRLREELHSHLLTFNQESAERVVLRLLMVPFEAALDEVYFPLLHRMGDDWQAGRVTVVQEHYATAFCREKLLVMLHSVQSAPRHAPEVTCATPPGEHHELGLLALSLRLGLRGYRITYLGANVPTADLVRHVSDRRPFALCLSMVHRRGSQEVADYARDLRRQVPAEVRIAIGGRGADFDAMPEVPGVSFSGNELPSWLDHRLAAASIR